MSKIKTKIEIYRELKRLNSEIDRKIIKGRPYRKEARRHRFLIAEFRALTGRRWLPRSLGFLSLIW